MKIHRFFIKDKIKENEIETEINDLEIIHQIKNVLRLKKGDKITIIDSCGNEYFCTLLEVMKKKLIFSKENVKKNSRKNEVIFVLYPSIIKKDKLEYVLQKCTEIGVLKFCPLVSDRTEKINFNMKRAETIIKEAAEQSEKCYLPSVMRPVNFDQLLVEYETKKFASDSHMVFYLDIEAPTLNVIQLKETLKKQICKKVSIFVGPEGGWSEIDRKKFHTLGVKPFSLGKTVLRAETASIAIASLLLLAN